MTFIIAESYFKHMKRFELDISRFVPKQIHHQLEVFHRRNVFRHDVEVGTVQQEFSKELSRGGEGGYGWGEVG